MKNFGGYFGLELHTGAEYHQGALRLNTGRNAFEYILRAKKYTKVYVPYYTCDVILQPISRLGLVHEFYSIDEMLEPVFNYDTIHNSEAFLYTNYFGLKDMFITDLAKKCRNPIIDNGQAFFSKPLAGIDSFYSSRKFFGVPDGAYLYTDTLLDIPLEHDKSYERFEHLLRRLDNGAEDGYPYFRKNDKLLDNLPIKGMSILTQRLLQSIDYQCISETRKNNFLFLHEKLQSINRLKVELCLQQAPMVYPLLVNSFGLRSELIRNKFFVPQYWPNVLEWTHKNDIEYGLATKLLPLPIDQRYGLEEMQLIVKAIGDFYKN